MNYSVCDITENPAWLAEQENRLLGFEVLRAFITHKGECAMDSLVISDKTLLPKGAAGRIVNKMAENPEILRKLRNG